ncbi:hypothetical protein [uncultured Methanobrevibacter sp.]|uniref:hypothetical protein n=1 Tax=uncultured Methanobrevibacter sp. TaxID=253161 RepID=UPI0025EC35D8|nr:hypothetical protein [uncultured Methanobrevibacter sp.]
MVNYIEELDSLLSEMPEIECWLDINYLNEISDEIVNLEDYVPKDIELFLPDYELRSSFLDNHDYLIDNEFHTKQILDQGAAGTTWQEHVSVYDDFFRKHPEFSKLIKNQQAYSTWKQEEPYYYSA